MRSATRVIVSTLGVIFGIGVLLLTFVAGFAYDIERQANIIDKQEVEILDTLNGLAGRI